MKSLNHHSKLEVPGANMLVGQIPKRESKVKTGLTGGGSGSINLAGGVTNSYMDKDESNKDSSLRF